MGEEICLVTDRIFIFLFFFLWTIPYLWSISSVRNQQPWAKPELTGWLLLRASHPLVDTKEYTTVSSDVLSMIYKLCSEKTTSWN